MQSHDELSEDEMRVCSPVERNNKIESSQEHQHQHQYQHQYQHQHREQRGHREQEQKQQRKLVEYQEHNTKTITAAAATTRTQHQHHHRSLRRLNTLPGNTSTSNSNNNISKNNKKDFRNFGDMSFVGTGATTSAAGGIVGGGGRSPVEQTELQINHHHQFPPNHPLNALGNFMGIGGLHGIPNLQHSDVLEKLKMQVRDMKVGLMEQDYAAAHAAAFGANVLPTPINTAFTLPPTSMSSFGHIPPGSSVVANGNSSHNAPSTLTNGAGSGSGGVGGNNGSGGGGGGFSFTSPTPPGSKDVNPASNSSTSSEASNSSTQQNNGWSFEEQYKQVRQLYEINDDPKRKEFLDELFSFMQKRGTPINRLPIMAKSVLDLYELYNLVIARGGLVEVINKKLWQEIIKGLHLPSSITSAAFTLRTQYMKYLYPFECDKMNLSAPAELQAAIDGNRREGRRSSYGQYEAMHTQMQMPQIARQSLAGSMQQMSPLALVTHAAANNQQAHAAAAAAAAHHRLIAPTFGQMPNLVTQEFEQRMMEYLKLIQAKKEQTAAVAAAAAAVGAGSGSGNAGVNADVANANSLVAAAAHQQQQLQQQAAAARHGSQSPEISTRDALNALEMSRVALWQMYHNNTSPPASVNTSPQLLGGGGIGGAGSSVNGGDEHEAGLNGGETAEPQREALNLNLSDSPPHVAVIKRERDPSPDRNEVNDFHQPPLKNSRLHSSRSGFPPNLAGFPASFYRGMAAAAAANLQHAANAAHHAESDAEPDEDVDEDGEHNTTGNTSIHDEHEQSERLNGHHRLHHNHNHNLRLDHDIGAQHHNQHQLHHHPHSHQLQHQLQLQHQHQHQHHNDKSDDSAIENSPSTSTSAGNGHISPISTKKIHLSKQANNANGAASTSLSATAAAAAAAASTARTSALSTLGAIEALNLLSGLQFRVAQSGIDAYGQQQLVVNLELNGTKYSGVLTANVASARVRADEAVKMDEEALSTFNAATATAAAKAMAMAAAVATGSVSDTATTLTTTIAATATTTTNTKTEVDKEAMQTNINVGNDEKDRAMETETETEHDVVNESMEHGEDAEEDDELDDDEEEAMTSTAIAAKVSSAAAGISTPTSTAAAIGVPATTLKDSLITT